MADCHTWIYTWFVMWAVILLNLIDLESERILSSSTLWTWSRIVTPSTLLGSAMAVASILNSLVIHKLYQGDRDIENLFWAGFAIRAEKALQTLKHWIFLKKSFQHLSAEELARRREEEKLKPAKSSKGSRQIKRYLIASCSKHRSARNWTNVLCSVRLEPYKAWIRIMVWNSRDAFQMFHVGIQECGKWHFCIWWKSS